MGSDYELTTAIVKRHKKLIEGNAALMVIDIQGKSIESFENSELEGLTLEGYVETIPKSKMVIDACRKVGMPIIYTQEWHRKDYVDFGRETDGSEGFHGLEGTDDIEIIQEVAPQEGDYLVPKQRYSCFFGTGLEILLNGLNVFPGDTLIFIGIMTNVCVHYGAMDAHQRDYHIRVIEECCAGASRRAHDAALEQINYLQTGATVRLDDMLRSISEYKPVRAQTPGAFAGFPIK